MSRVRFAPKALADVDRIDTWWQANRPAAPNLFSAELTSALALLRESPAIGTPYAAPTRLPVRRLLLLDTQVHVYYRLNEVTGSVVILRVWSVRRGRGPALH